MSTPRYELHPRAHWAIGELLRRIKKDFENPEVEAAFQKWKEERDRERAEKESGKA